MISRIIKRDGRVVGFDREKIAFAVYRAAIAVGGRDLARSQFIAQQVSVQLQQQYADERPPTVEDVQDLVEKMLIEHGHARTAKAYIVYRYEHSLKRMGRESLTYNSENIPYKKLWQTLAWAVDHNLTRVSDFAARQNAKEQRQLVEDSERFYEDQLDAVHQRVTESLGELRLIIIAGPSSSGKTTTTAKLAQRLAGLGRRLVPISVDNYFFDLKSHPKSPDGDYDFETPQAIDMELFNSQLSDLLSGREITLPRYDFKLGRREGNSGQLRCGEHDIILLDCLHGLHEPLTASVARDQKLKLYIETLSQVRAADGGFLRWTDVRMMRRSSRDSLFRGYPVRQTVLHWPMVRRAELRYIVSQLKNADQIINSFLHSELPVWKARLQGPYRQLLIDLSRETPTDQIADAMTRLTRVVSLFEELSCPLDESLIPEHSLLREFIGGSCYNVH